MARTFADFLTLAQAAELASLDPGTLRQQIRNGRLTAQKLGRDWLVTRENLQAYIDQRWTRAKKKGKT